MSEAQTVKQGPARMRELGHVAVTIWLDPRQVAEFDRERGRVKRATFAKLLIGQGMRERTQYRKRA